MAKGSNDRLIDAYYTDVSAGSLLTAEEEKRLFVSYRTCGGCKRTYTEGSTQARCPKCDTPRDFKSRDKLVAGALRFVVKVAKDYVRRLRGNRFFAYGDYENDLLMNLVSAGNLGLLVAVDRFEFSRNTRFLTYAAWWIREKILEELCNTGVVRVPAYRQKAVRAKRKRGDAVAHDDPANISVESIEDIEHKFQNDRFEKDIVNTYGVDAIHLALRKLGVRGRDQYVVITYFGLREEPKNLRQISNRLGLSSERVRQIKEGVLDMLKEYLNNNKISTTDDAFS